MVLQLVANLYGAGEVTGGVHGANRLGGNAFADIKYLEKEQVKLLLK